MGFDFNDSLANAPTPIDFFLKSWPKNRNFKICGSDRDKSEVSGEASRSDWGLVVEAGDWRI